MSSRGVTAALYTGQEGSERTLVSTDGLITSRREIRDNPPDILLTNYKMLDQLLLRADDAPIWERSARLQYLVLDEFHTYDAPRAPTLDAAAPTRPRAHTDMAMLLRPCARIPHEVPAAPRTWSAP
ncbi:hypothetical protein [Georgenia sp. SUBG003]|uniref:hypothetical protein n=1 Tax=Georgenia sp. SUBG003 TaxID=1497974 RepID=UPI003AB1297C